MLTKFGKRALGIAEAPSEGSRLVVENGVSDGDRGRGLDAHSDQERTDEEDECSENRLHQ